MPMENPLAESYAPVPDDASLAAQAAAGDQEALEALLRRHQPWIFNLAMRMFYGRADAEDATQEVLLKTAMGLSSFRGESSFRTWLYRVAANHFLDRKKSTAEKTIHGFGCYGGYLDKTSDEELFDPSSDFPQTRLLVEEAKLGCMLGMLLCLDREQRLVFVLGEIFEISDRVGSEALGLSKENFRQKLARARKQLASFMAERCSLITPAGPCRCARKTKAFIKAGIVDPLRLQFVEPYVTKVREVSGRQRGEFEALVDRNLSEVFRDHPFFDPPDIVARLHGLIEGQRFRAILDLDPKPY
jgi:RNA polymerase sigma factor (sigma-70 family)